MQALNFPLGMGRIEGFLSSHNSNQEHLFHEAIRGREREKPRIFVVKADL